MPTLTRFAFIALTICCALTFVVAQRRPAPQPKKEITEIDATTRDGKTVILKSDGTWRYATPSERAAASPPVAKATLSLETGIIYRTGEVIPVARTTFYLLDDDVMSIAKNGGVQPRAETMGIYKDLDRALVSDIAYSLAGQYQSQFADFAANLLRVLEPHIIAKFTTDFSGKATIADLDPKQVYLFGAGATRRSSAMWNLKIDLAKETHIVLDQNNAAFVY